MTISIAATTALPPSRETDAPRISPASAMERVRTEEAVSTDKPKPPPMPAPTASERSKEVVFDEQSGRTIVRTFDIDTGDVVAQMPTEAYLRLAQVMTAAIQAEESGSSAADIVA